MRSSSLDLTGPRILYRFHSTSEKTILIFLLCKLGTLLLTLSSDASLFFPRPRNSSSCFSRHLCSSYLPVFHCWLPFVNHFDEFHSSFSLVDETGHVPHGVQGLLDILVILMLGVGVFQQFIQLQRILTNALNGWEKETIEFQLDHVRL